MKMQLLANSHSVDCRRLYVVIQLDLLAKKVAVIFPLEVYHLTYKGFACMWTDINA